MKNLGRTVTALAAVVSILGPGAQRSALADNAVMQLTGTGTISPGLVIAPTNQDVGFCGTGRVAAGSHAGTYSFCYFGYDSGTATSHSGCGTFSGDMSGDGCYTCTGTQCQWTGTVTFDGTTFVIQAGNCGWAPTSVNPITSYAMSCVWVLSH